MDLNREVPCGGKPVLSLYRTFGVDCANSEVTQMYVFIICTSQRQIQFTSSMSVEYGSQIQLENTGLVLIAHNPLSKEPLDVSLFLLSSAMRIITVRRVVCDVYDLSQSRIASVSIKSRHVQAGFQRGLLFIERGLGRVN